MADGHARSKGRRLWALIVGLILVAFLIWLLAGISGRDRDVATPETETGLPTVPPVAPIEPPPSAAEPVPPAVADLATACVEPPAPGGAAASTADCLGRLATAIDAVVGEEARAAGVESRLDDFHRAVERAGGSGAEADAGRVREAFTAAAELLAAIQEERYPEAVDLEAQLGELRQAAEAIEADAPLADQQDSLRTFFRDVTDALRGIAAQQPVTV